MTSKGQREDEGLPRLGKRRDVFVTGYGISVRPQEQGTGPTEHRGAVVNLTVHLGDVDRVRLMGSPHKQHRCMC